MRATFPSRRWRWAHGRVAQNALPDTPVGVGTVPPACGDSTTYVRDRAHDGGLGDNRRCSSAPGSGRRNAPRRNSQAGHKREQKSFCCVTTRPGLRPGFSREALPRHQGVPSAATCSTLPGTPLTLRCRMRLTNFRLLTPLLLPLGGLPAAHEFPALRVLAVPLIPPPGLVDAVTPSAQADPRAETPAAGRKSLAETMLEDVPRGGSAPGGAAREIGKISRAFLFDLFALPGRDDGSPQFSGTVPPRPIAVPPHTLCGRNSPRRNRDYRKSSSRRSRATGEGRRQGRRRCRCTSTGEGDEGRRRRSKTIPRCSLTRC